MTDGRSPVWGAVLLAAGRGERFGGDVPKQFVEVSGRHVLSWALDSLAGLGLLRSIVVVLPQGRAGGWSPPEGVACVLAEGGPRRQDSVRNGLAALDPRIDHVLVHDAARPFAGGEAMSRVIEAAERTGAAVPVIPVSDTLKRLEGGRVACTLDRTGLWASQTPQGFRRDILEAAMDSQADFTDECAALEIAGFEVSAVEGDPLGVKLTSQADLRLLEKIAPAPARRMAVGFDAHPASEGRPLVVCGCRLSSSGGLEGHSDGDAVLHAVADAVLSCARAGDMGVLFPPSDESLRGADSSVLLSRALTVAGERGWRVVSADITLIGEFPRVSRHREAMLARLAGILGVGPDAVWIKGTTTNSLGCLGRGEGLACIALVEMENRPG